MSEFESRKALSTAQVVETCARVESDRGDVTYTSDRFADDLFRSDLTEPFQLRMSAGGVLLVEQTPKILALLDIEQSHSVLKRTVGRGKNHSRTTIAVKQTYVNPSYDYGSIQLNGLQLFQAFRALRAEGVRCSVPLLATKWKFVYRWMDGGRVDNAPDTKRYEYIRALLAVAAKLRFHGKWNPTWDIDYQPSNYLVDDLESGNILNWFKTFDTVADYGSEEVREKAVRIFLSNLNK